VIEAWGRLLRKGDYVYGSFMKPEAVDGYINGVNPGDRADVLGRFAFSEINIDEAVEFARVGYRVWRRTSINDRSGVVHRFRDHVARHQESTALLITRETGKPLWEARQEMLATIRVLDLMLDDGVHALAPRVIDEICARSDWVSRGVVGIFTPFNFPFLIAASHTAATVLAGCAAVVKPSKFTPGIGQRHIEMWDRCQMPRGVVNMVQGPGSVVGQRLATHPAIDAILFTGSYSTARTITKLTMDRPELPIFMQCGGKGTALVLDDAALDRAVYEVMIGAFLTAGQRHNSTGRVIVTDKVYDEFVTSLVKHTKRLSVGYGFEPDVFMGPLISENLRTRYRRFSRALLSKGHNALIDTSYPRTEQRGFYARPAIFEVNWENGHPFIDQEPPGPTLLVYRVASWEQAVALHNQVSARIATSLFTDPNRPNMRELRDRLRTGALNINRGTIGASLRLPSVGLGSSSIGIIGGLQLLQFLAHPRSQLSEQRAFKDMPLLPGTNWNETTEVEVTQEEPSMPTADDPTEVGDISSLLIADR
jgi:acyl-CoA reductase-like NAD-dependent aldehyde dehydrogenase